MQERKKRIEQKRSENTCTLSTEAWQPNPRTGCVKGKWATELAAEVFGGGEFKPWLMFIS